MKIILFSFLVRNVLILIICSKGIGITSIKSTCCVKMDTCCELQLQFSILIIFFVSVTPHSGTNCDASRGFIPCDVWIIKRPLHYSRVSTSERQWNLEFSLVGMGMLYTDQLLDNSKGRGNGLDTDKNVENWVAFHH